MINTIKNENTRYELECDIRKLDIEKLSDMELQQVRCDFDLVDEFIQFLLKERGHNMDQWGIRNVLKNYGLFLLALAENKGIMLEFEVEYVFCLDQRYNVCGYIKNWGETGKVLIKNIRKKFGYIQFDKYVHQFKKRVKKLNKEYRQIAGNIAFHYTGNWKVY